MTHPQRARTWCWLALVVFLALGSSAGKAVAAKDAGEFLVTFGHQAAEQLNDGTLSPQAREALFRKLLQEAVDLEAIVKFVLGRHWRRASDEELTDFSAVFEDVALQRFLPMFTRADGEYRGESFDVLDIRRSSNAEDQVFVHSQVQRPEGPPVVLVWRLRERDDEYKVLDVSVEGISMALTLREEYGSVIRQQGGVAALVKLIREKLNAGAYAPKTDQSSE